MWTCKNCNEISNDIYNVCWKCNSNKNGTKSANNEANKKRRKEMTPKMKKIIDIIVREAIISVSVLGAISFLGIGGLMIGIGSKTRPYILGYVALIMWALAGIIVTAYIVYILIRIIIWAVKKLKKP